MKRKWQAHFYKTGSGDCDVFEDCSDDCNTKSEAVALAKEGLEAKGEYDYALVVEIATVVKVTPETVMRVEILK